MVAVEDIHWADAVLLDYLATIAATAADCPALLVMTHRVEGEPLNPAWRGAMHGAPLTTIDLGPLHDDEARALAAELKAENAGFVARCIERAGGNPLFLEQLLRSRPEGDAVPDSVRSIVWARLDCLDVADRRAAQAAAVLSQRSAPAALHHLLDVADYDVSPLVEQRLLRPQGEDYQFSHALIRQGVYDSLLGSQRRALHERAAEWFRRHDAPLTARHLDRAESPEAPRAYLDAARSQMETYRYEHAEALIRRGLELAREASDRFALMCQQGDVSHATGTIDAAVAAYRRAVDCATDDEQRCRAWLGVAAGYSVQDRHDDALAALDEAERLAGDRVRPLAELYSLRGNVLFVLGRLADCLKAHRRARRYAEQAGAPELEARALSGLGDADYMRGRMITAYKHFDRCVELCRRQDLARIEATNLPMRGFTHFYQNDLRAAQLDAQQAVELAARIGHLRAETMARDLLFHVLNYQDDLPAAREQAERGLVLARRFGGQRFEAGYRLYLGQVLLAEGQRDAAERHLDGAYAFSREASLAFIGPWILGALAAATDDTDKGRRALAEAEALLAAGSISHNYLHFYPLAIDVALDDGDWPAVARYCSALEDYTRAEPLPWCALFIARGRALAAWGSGCRDAATRRGLRNLADECERTGLRTALPALQAALSQN